MYVSEVFANDIERLFNDAVKRFKEYLALKADLPYTMAFDKCHLSCAEVLAKFSKDYNCWTENMRPYTTKTAIDNLFKIYKVSLDEHKNVVVTYDYYNVEDIVYFEEFDLPNQMAFIEGVCRFLDRADDKLHPEKDLCSYRC